MLIALLIKYKRRKRAPELSTPVNIQLETNKNLQEPLPAISVNQVNYTYVHGVGNTVNGYYIIWTSMRNSFYLIELSGINKVGLGFFFYM